MLKNLVKTLDTCIKYNETKGNKKKVKLLKKKRESAKKNSLESEILG